MWVLFYTMFLTFLCHLIVALYMIALFSKNRVQFDLGSFDSVVVCVMTLVGYVAMSVCIITVHLYLIHNNMVMILDKLSISIIHRHLLFCANKPCLSCFMLLIHVRNIMKPIIFIGFQFFSFIENMFLMIIEITAKRVYRSGLIVIYHS